MEFYGTWLEADILLIIMKPFTIRKAPSNNSSSAVVHFDRKGIDSKCCAKVITFIIILLIQISLFTYYFFKYGTPSLP